MIPLVLLDIDGTVIGASGTVDDCVWEAVDRVQEAGVRLAVCTGRPWGGVAQKVAARLGPETPHIFQSGALIAYPDGEAVQVYALKDANTEQLIEHARDHSLTLELYSPNALFVERRTPLSESHAKMLGVSAIVRDLQDVMENEPIVRAQWVVTEAQADTALSLNLETAQFSRATSPAQPNTFFISVTQKGVSKGAAAGRLAEELKVELRNVMGVGDTSGDLPMLERVGHPIVMGNASEDLRARFESVGDVEDCGVAEALAKALERPVT